MTKFPPFLRYPNKLQIEETYFQFDDGKYGNFNEMKLKSDHNGDRWRRTSLVLTSRFTHKMTQYIVEAGLAETGVIAVTQPRTFSTSFIAERVAKEYGCQLGQEVGYSVRFDSKTSNRTKIKYMTDSMLLRESIADQMLWSYSWIVLDEAHERTMNTDLLFGIVKAAFLSRKKNRLLPLKVVIISANIEENKIANYFHDALIYNILERFNKFEIFYSDESQFDYVHAALSTVLDIHQNKGEGDILVFLPKIEEIQALKEKFDNEAQSKSGLELQFYPLYDTLPSNEKKAALMPAQPKTRKVVVSTNIAETSLTIRNIRYVIDSGFVESKFHYSEYGSDCTSRVSKAVAYQRAGIAGRDTNGECHRLYSEEEFKHFREFPVPEIMRCHLSNVLLQIAAIGDIENFVFIDKPPDEHIQKAVEELNYFGAVERSMTLKLTELGKKMTEFPLDIKFSKILLMSEQLRCTDEILTIISLLSIETIFLSSEVGDNVKRRSTFPALESDHVRMLKVFRAFKGAAHKKIFCIEHMVDYKGMRRAIAIRKELAEICQILNIPLRSCGRNMSVVRKCLTYGLFMNSAQLNEKKNYTTLSNDEVSVHPTSALFLSKPKHVVYTELDDFWMMNVSVIEEDWLQAASSEYFENSRH